MSSFSKPRIVVYKADSSISQGSAVKPGHASGYVAKGAANTDRCIGIANNTASASDSFVEVALPGGGGQALLSEAVVAGNDLVSHTDGSLALPNASGDEIIARALSAGSTSDLVDVEVVIAKALASQ